MSWRAGLIALVSTAAVSAMLVPAASAAAPRSTPMTVAAPPADGSTAISSNWSGYAVASASDVPARFTRVTGRWTVPAAACVAGPRSFAAFWVGLGGLSDASESLEQIGTSSDCSASGAARYSMWYELVPAASVVVKLKLFPRNVVAATVTVAGTKVTVQIRNLSRNTKFQKTLRMTSPDVSSADWIAEAPAACGPRGCQVLPLANFGSVSFAHAAATASGHAGTIADTAWSYTPISLVSDPQASADPSAAAPPVGATPTALSPSGDAFTVTWLADASALLQPAAP